MAERPFPEPVPLSPTIGARIPGIDLSTPLTEELVAKIRQALAVHLVLFFDDQSLTPARLLALGRELGVPERYPFVDGIDGYPEVIEVLKLPEEKVNFGGVWHSDTAYLERPAAGALLYGVEIPESGGDTLFSNMYTAWSGLSPGLQRLLEGLSAVNDSDKPAIARTRLNRLDGSARERLRAVHPVACTHPITGRKLLYVNEAHTTHFEGWNSAESQGLLRYLFSVQHRPENCCRFRWREGSLALWDNRACQHYPLNDYPGQTRRMLRVSLAGDKPV